MLPTNIISEATEDRKLLSCQTTQWGQNVFEKRQILFEFLFLYLGTLYTSNSLKLFRVSYWAAKKQI